MSKIIVGHVRSPPAGYQCVICDRTSFLGNPYGFNEEKYRDASVKNCGLWLWDNFKLSEELDCMPIEMTFYTNAPIYTIEGLHIAQGFKNPTVSEVMRELQFIADVVNQTGNVALLCWCKGNKNPKIEDKACHCDRIKACIERLFL
ncbi:DUF4326 domain-containing protein [Pseudanabaena sp. 'Roaring Creek']|uniref:DUF4326 domain-containing protein n=1 Tax=Pseudanabaena sp. 'Roaring Creek' TaxID=1681830 RepID=UPI0006D84E66|nr:DUF4326 domain-containing protein [Pseudanabaena sp. 'Roaring Creek']